MVALLLVWGKGNSGSLLLTQDCRALVQSVKTVSTCTRSCLRAGSCSLVLLVLHFSGDVEFVRVKTQEYHVSFRLDAQSSVKCSGWKLCSNVMSAVCQRTTTTNLTFL